MPILIILFILSAWQKVLDAVPPLLICPEPFSARRADFPS
jgi:hypothetical protein